MKGAFTDAKTDRVGSFELADGGTLFLDEIANVSLKQQAKLLRVLESGDLQRVGSSRVRRVDVRVLAATNADLAREVAEGRFREDLLYRLNTVEIRLPPLCASGATTSRSSPRSSCGEQAARYKQPAVELTPGAMRALLEHPWPGNVRELRHAVERAVLMARGPVGDRGRSRAPAASHHAAERRHGRAHRRPHARGRRAAAHPARARAARRQRRAARPRRSA